jgi:Fur family ferric uptake transcriptional regulator
MSSTKTSKKQTNSHDFEHVVHLLKRARLRITEPRVALIQMLLKNHGPFTAEELYKQMTQNVCDLATIYRTLGSLEKAGMLKRCEFGDGSARYELFERNDHHHHHLICRSCKAISVLDDCELEEIDQIPKKRGFKEISHSLEFFGICPKCQAKK